MSSFDPNEHKGARPLEVPGRYVMHITRMQQQPSRKGDFGVRMRCEVLLGGHKGQYASRLFMFEGLGTRWTGDLCRALNIEKIDNAQDPSELSRRLGLKPFAAFCRPGRVMKDADGNPMVDNNNVQRRYIEVAEVAPLREAEISALAKESYAPQDRDDLMVEGFGGEEAPMGGDDIPF